MRATSFQGLLDGPADHRHGPLEIVLLLTLNIAIFIMRIVTLMALFSFWAIAGAGVAWSRHGARAQLHRSRNSLSHIRKRVRRQASREYCGLTSAT